MRIWLARHGETDLNKNKRMQGRSDVPLNETGRWQAGVVRKAIASEYGEVTFDAVFASPLDRAIETASIISGFSRDEIQIDDRIMETDFGKYEQRPYTKMGAAMTLYWALPEVFPAPDTVESIASMRERSQSFVMDLKDLCREKNYENVLVTCHGGIIRALSGCLAERRNGLMWRPKPKNCEVRIFDSFQPGNMQSILVDFGK